MSARPSTIGNRLLEDLLLKTSRTFALSIPVLPEPTRREVTVAYLLFRIADTLEDATRWSSRRQVHELERLSSLLSAPRGEVARRLAADWQAEPPLDHDGYLELLRELPAVLDAFLDLRVEARAPVAHHVRRTIEQMARFVSRDEGADTPLRDIDQLRAYCYAVAGIVGEMLTELFLLGRPELDPVADELRRDAARFGEALQLVNILKDSAADASEGRRYLPLDRDGDVLALAREDLDVAGAYVARLERAGASRGLVAFTALPILLAWGTLDKFERDGPGSKLSRDQVSRIVTEMNGALDRRAVAQLWDRVTRHERTARP